MKKINFIALFVFILFTLAACTQKQIIQHWKYEGEHNHTIQTLWNNLPEEIGKGIEVHTTKINAADLLPDDRSYYRYHGSFTTPPCTEGVNWHVLKTPVEMSEAQIKKFKTVVGYNSRPVQPVNKRFILESL